MLVKGRKTPPVFRIFSLLVYCSSNLHTTVLFVNRTFSRKIKRGTVTGKGHYNKHRRPNGNFSLTNKKLKSLTMVLGNAKLSLIREKTFGHGRILTQSIHLLYELLIVSIQHNVCTVQLPFFPCCHSRRNREYGVTKMTM